MHTLISIMVSYLPAMYNDWSIFIPASLLSALHVPPDQMPEVDERSSTLWGSMIRPNSEVKLVDYTSFSLLETNNYNSSNSNSIKTVCNFL